jgi:O-antigen/teichoic acid export membrane protein
VSLAKVLFSGRGATLATNLALLCSGVASSVLVSRTLAPAGRGEYVTWQAWGATIAIVAIGGLPQVLVLDPRAAGRHTAREILPALLATAGLGAAAVGILAFVRHPGAALVIGTLLALATNQLATIGPSEAQRMGNMGFEFNAARLTPQVAALIAMGVLLYSGAGSAAAWLIVVSALQAAAALAWIVGTAGRRTHLLRRGRRAGPAHAAPPAPAVALLRDALVLAPANWATQVQYRLDILAVATLFPPATVAYYAIGAAAQSAVLAAGQAGGMYWFARRPGSASLRVELGKTVAIALLLAVPLAATTPLWLPVVYGHAFIPAVPVVMVLCVVGVAQSVDYLLAHDALKSGRGARAVLYRLPALAALVALYGTAARSGWSLTALALVPGAGFLLSSATFLATRRRRPAAATPLALPAPVGEP